MRDCLVQETPVPASLVGELTDSTTLLENSEALRERLEQDGYLLVRGAVDRQCIAAARSEVFNRLAEVGEIRAPASAGIASGTSRRREQEDDLGAFWRSVSQGPALRAATSRAGEAWDFGQNHLAKLPTVRMKFFTFRGCTNP